MSCRPRLLVAALLLAAACEGEPPRRPNVMHPVHERRANDIIARTFRDNDVEVEVDRQVYVEHKPMRVDVAAMRHRYGVAYITADDAAQLGPSIPAYDPQSESLTLVDAEGDGGTWHVLVLYERAYMTDDLEGEQHSATQIAAERKIERDARDFLVKAEHEQWP